jgi:GT2 family glycosyltransferase
MTAPSAPSERPDAGTPADPVSSSAVLTNAATPPWILVVIVNYRCADLTLDCLRSLVDEQANWPEFRVVVTDNASGDDSVERLQRAVEENDWDSWITIQPLESNGGFSYGNNAAIAPAIVSPNPPEFVLLLNPDTYIYSGAIRDLVAEMRLRPEVGIAGGQLEGEDGSIQGSAFRFPSILGTLEGEARFGPLSRLLRRWIVSPKPPSEPKQVDWVPGAYMIVRLAVFEAIGLLDEGYFMYFEETDFCLRALRAGWPCWYLPSCRIVHLVGQVSGVTGSSQPRKRRPRYWFDSHRRYFVLNHGRWTNAAVNLAWLMGNAFASVRRLLTGKPAPDPPGLFLDYLRFNVLSRGGTRDRRRIGIHPNVPSRRAIAGNNSTDSAIASPRVG